MFIFKKSKSSNRKPISFHVKEEEKPVVKKAASKAKVIAVSEEIIEEAAPEVAPVAPKGRKKAAAVEIKEKNEE